jgi:hypothetical protein
VHFVGLSVVNWLSTMHEMNNMELISYLFPIQWKCVCVCVCVCARACVCANVCKFRGISVSVAICPYPIDNRGLVPRKSHNTKLTAHVYLPQGLRMCEDRLLRLLAPVPKSLATPVCKDTPLLPHLTSWNITQLCIGIMLPNFTPAVGYIKNL